MTPIEIELNLCIELIALEIEAGRPDPEYLAELQKRQGTAFVEACLQ